jgi:hypothetical protein
MERFLPTHNIYPQDFFEEQENNSEGLFLIYSQTNENFEFNENVYYHNNTNSSQNSQNSQKTNETNIKPKEMFAIDKNESGRRHTHKKEDKDNILRKITNRISKTGINKANELIQKKTTKKYRLNIVTYKGKFNKEDYPTNFLNLTLKTYFSQNQNNKNIIDKVIEQNHELAEFLEQKFEDYIESKDIDDDLIKVKNELSLKNDIKYIDRFENFWKNLKKIINGTLKRNQK